MRWPTPRRMSSAGQETPDSMGGTWVSNSFGFQKSRPPEEVAGGAGEGSGSAEAAKLLAGTTSAAEGVGLDGSAGVEVISTRDSGASCAAALRFGFIGT